MANRFVEKVFDFFRGGEKALTIGGESFPVEMKSASLCMGWFDMRDKLSELNNGAAGSLVPKMTVQKAFYAYRSWIYACVNLIQRKIVETDYYLYQEIGQPNDEEFNRIHSHPLLKLLKHPNQFLSGRQLRQTTQAHLDLTGMAFWLILHNMAGVPGELHVMSPSTLVQIIRGDRSDNLIERFAFAPPYQRNMRREYAYAEIVYFHYPDPDDPVVPYSPLQALSQIIDLDSLLQNYEKNFFHNNARPDFLFKTQPGQDFTDAEADRFHAQWDSRHRGAGKGHRPAILSGGLDVVPLGMSARDFEFVGLSEYIKDMILATYGIPEAELGLFESFNKASSITSETKFVKGCIEPRLKLWEDVLNTQLKPLFHNTDDLEFRHESALPKDDEWNLTETQGNLSMGLTSINEVRKKDGKKPYESPLCDVPWGPTGEPIRGCSAEADKLWDEKMQMMMGGAQGGAPGEDPNAQAQGAQGGVPGGNPMAQGAMGQFGGRPEGQALSTLFNSASRRTNTAMSTLLNAARGRRGGLAQLLRSHPQEIDLTSMLGRNRQDQALSRLLGSFKGQSEEIVTKGVDALTSVQERMLRQEIYAWIEEGLEGIDRVMFRPYEAMVKALDPIEVEYLTETQSFFVRQGNSLAGMTQKMLTDFVEKGPVDGVDLEALRQDYIRLIEPLMLKGVEVGLHAGFDLIEKAGGKVGSKDPESYAQEAAGRLLEHSADLREDSARKAITGILQDAIAEGTGTDDVADSIRGEFQDMTEHRATRIARTEMSAALNAGLDASFRQANDSELTVKEARVWTALDERVCDECDEVHDTVGIDYIKNKVKQELPVHPNCRCVYRPELV